MDIQERLTRFLGKKSDTVRAAFVAPNATVLGDVTLGAQSSVWYGCVVRGDINSIFIGEGTDIQDLTMVHLADDYGDGGGIDVNAHHAGLPHSALRPHGDLESTRL